LHFTKLDNSLKCFHTQLHGVLLQTVIIFAQYCGAYVIKYDILIQSQGKYSEKLFEKGRNKTLFH